ncbi:MAG: response regulator [Azospirillaceae bacterium]
MTPSRQLAPHLPYLRRYARALTGDQDSGDGLVRRCLEALVADPARLAEGPGPRVVLFRALHDLMAAGEAGDGAGPRGHEPGVEDSLHALTPTHREALLLATMEGFPLDDVAAILRRDRDDAEALIAAARSAFESLMAASILIIEDEPIIALDLKAIVEGMRHTVLSIARTAAEAETQAERHRPDLILADIRLADGSSGIDAVREITARMRVPVIFITAYPEELLTGERVEPAYLITKPFLEDAVRAMVGHVLFANSPAARPV